MCCPLSDSGESPLQAFFRCEPPQIRIRCFGSGTCIGSWLVLETFAEILSCIFSHFERNVYEGMDYGMGVVNEIYPSIELLSAYLLGK